MSEQERRQYQRSFNFMRFNGELIQQAISPGKQFTGLADCQARDLTKLDFHFNSSLTALNLAKLDAVQQHDSETDFVFKGGEL